MTKKKKLDKEKMEEYIQFLEKRINSTNFKNNVTTEEFNKTKTKLKNERLKFKLLFGK